MKFLRSMAFAAFAGYIGLALLPTLQADTWDRKPTLTVTEPPQVPSGCTPGHTVTLQPCEYVVVLADSLSDRHIVRIYNKDRIHVMTTILAMPDDRLKPPGETVFQYWKVPAGQPPVLRAWFHPGGNLGQEFAYSKQTAVQFAAFVKARVPVIEVETRRVEELKTVPVVAVDESGKTADLMATLPVRAPDAALERTLQAAPQAAPVQPHPADRAVYVETFAPMQTLPHTAGATPLLGLAGLVSMALSAALRIRSRRRRPCKD